MTSSIFDRSPGELSDDELRVGAFVAAQERDQAARAGDPDRAGFYGSLAAVLAAERASRRGLALEVDAAMCPFTVGPVTVG